MIWLRLVIRRIIFRLLASCRFLLSLLHVLQLLVMLLPCHRSLIRLLRLLLVVLVLVFIVITVVEMDMWMPFAIGRWIPFFVAGQGTLFSDSFYVPDISLVPDLTM
jgi:hypothetical protein